MKSQRILQHMLDCSGASARFELKMIRAFVASDAKAPSLFTGNIPSSKLITEKMHFIKDLCDKRNIQISYIKDECTNPAEDEINQLCAQ